MSMCFSSIRACMLEAESGGFDIPLYEPELPKKVL